MVCAQHVAVILALLVRNGIVAAEFDILFLLGLLFLLFALDVGGLFGAPGVADRFALVVCLFERRRLTLGLLDFFSAPT
jgi:hypothetical protein